MQRIDTFYAFQYFTLITTQAVMDLDIGHIYLLLRIVE